MQRLIVSDFDRTLFNVNAFFIDLCSQILSDESVTNSELRAEIKEHLLSGKHSSYRPFMERYHVDLQGVMTKVNYTLRHKSYLYEDVDDFLFRCQQDKVLIMSVGVQEYQEAKFQLVDDLSHYDRVVIDENKGEYLKSNLKISKESLLLESLAEPESYRELILIDDRRDMLEPLIGTPLVKLYHIERPDAKYPSRSKLAGIQSINSLEEIKL